MNFIKIEIVEDIAMVSLSRGKVNAINNTLVDELIQCLETLAADVDIKAIVLTGRGKFFSFGFDIPEFLSFSKAEFTDFLTRFTGLYTYPFHGSLHLPVHLPETGCGRPQRPHDRRGVHAGTGLRLPDHDLGKS